MRKFLISTLFVFLSTISFAQTLGYRNDTAERLLVGTNYIIRGQQLGVSLEYSLNKITKDEHWNLSFILYSRDELLTIDKDSKLLIRTFSGSVIELTQKNDIYSIKHDMKYPYSSDWSVVDYLVYPDYTVSAEGLQKLMKEGIKKMRFETTKGMIDLEWDKDYFGADILSEYNLILDKSDFSDSF